VFLILLMHGANMKIIITVIERGYNLSLLGQKNIIKC